MDIYSSNSKLINHKFITFFVCILLIFCEVFFFRNIIFNGFLFGDSGDGRLTMLITEHWFHFFQGKAELTDLGIFYPEVNTLAYSDMLLGYGLIHSVFRFLGVDVFNAYKFTLILIHLIGSLSAYFFLNKCVKIKTTSSLFGVIAFSFSCTYAYKAYHTQFFAMSFLPVICIFFILFCRNISVRYKRNIYAYLFILSMVLLLYTSWYVTFFSALFSIILFVIYLIILLINKIDLKSYIISFIKIVKLDFLLYFLLFAFLLIPFAKIELSIMDISGTRGYSSLNVSMPEFIDIINVSDNWMFGKLISGLNLSERGLSSEVIQGFSIIVILFFVISIFIVCTNNRFKDNDNNLVFLFQKATVISVLTNLLFAIKLSSNGISLWWFVHKFFPGGSAIRAIGRELFFLSFPMSMITAIVYDKVLSFSFKSKEINRYLKIASVLIVITLFLSNIRIGGVNSMWNRDDSIDFISNVAVPPDDCECFFISIDETSTYRSTIDVQLDAYQIADYFNLKTINGYSGVFSNTWWNNVWDVYNPNYEMKVAEYLVINEISDVYKFDLNANKWSKFDPYKFINECFYPDGNITTIKNGISEINPQSDYCWTSSKCSLIIKDSNISKNGLAIKLGFFPDKYISQNPDIEPYCHLYVNGMYIQELNVDCSDFFTVVNIPPSDDDIYQIEIETNCYFVPKDQGINEDERELSFKLYYMGSPI